jgi:Holliday junction resolvase-like predicted endonuclease
MNTIINKANFQECCDILNEDIFYIKDHLNGRSEISNDKDYHCIVINKKRFDISFLKIDKCVFNDGDDKKCDFALANDEYIYFVEVKGLEKFDDHSKKKNKRKEAKIQLIKTINFFKHNNPELDLKYIFAIIAIYPVLEDSYSKIITLKDQIVIDKFVEGCGCPNIFEGNRIEFK